MTEGISEHFLHNPQKTMHKMLLIDVETQFATDAM